MKTPVKLLALGAAASALLVPAGAARAQTLITGNDEKVWFDETGKTVNQPPGKDTVSIIDIHDPAKPRIIANLPLNEHDHRTAGQSRHHPRPAPGACRQLARVGQGRRGLERGCPTTRSM